MSRPSAVRHPAAIDGGGAGLSQTDQYNRFIIAYRPELQRSDAELKTYFIRQGSEAAYDTFKTKLANLSSLSTIANGPAYCDAAAASFEAALSSRQALDDFVASQQLMISQADPVRAGGSFGPRRADCRAWL